LGVPAGYEALTNQEVSAGSWRKLARMRAVFVFVKTELGHVTDVANRIAEVESFSEAFSVSGEYDLLVKLYVDDVDNIGRLIEKEIHPIPHIRETHTILTFEAFQNR
jgi:DNA-binding Lrp family transcriptional regulator